MNTQTVTTKICSKCGEEKSLEMFYKNSQKKDGRLDVCKPCHIQRMSVHQKNLLKTNPEKIRERNEKWVIKANYSGSAAQHATARKSYYKTRNKPVPDQGSRPYHRSGLSPSKASAKWSQTQYNLRGIYYIKHNLRRIIRYAFSVYSSKGKIKSSKEYGIDYNEIFQKLGPKPEGKFNIDHIIPISVFNLDNPEHVRLSHHPENLRWLDATENILKSDSIDWSLIESSEVLSNIAKEIGLVKE